MKRMKWLLFGILGLGALSLTGCFFISARPTGVVEGYVVDAGAGSPVVGALVTAYPLNGKDGPIYWVGSSYFSPTAITDESGHYKLVLPEGKYVVTVTKEGLATTRIEGMVVASTYKLDIIQKPVFNPNWPLEPPEVTVTIEGKAVAPGDEIILDAAALADGLNYRVNAQGPNDIKYIYVALGKTPGASYTTGTRELFESTYTTGDASLNPADYGVEGWTTFEVVVYDVNENRTHLICKVYVPEVTGPGTLNPPPGLDILAVTLGKKVAFYSEPIVVPSGGGDLTVHAAPEGGNLYVELTWEASPDDQVVGGTGITGYRIYRKLAGESDYTLIGTVASGDGVWDESTSPPTFLYYLFRDASPALQAGVEVSYQVRAYKGSTESAPVEATTTPLDIWDVRLLEPADNATDVSLTPTFRWEPTKVVGKDQLYRVRIYDTVQGWYSGLSSGDPENLRNKTECTWGEIYVYSYAYGAWISKEGTPWERLQPHRSYEWLVDFAVAYDDYDNPTAISIAVNDGATGEYLSVPATDFFQFTTGAE